MPEVAFGIDYARSMFDQEVPGHNRWHPDIPIASEVSPGDEFRIECLDWTDGQVKNDDSANDIRDMSLDRCHVLSGPVGIKGAQPGDLLVVDILDLGPIPQSKGDLPGQGWGYTGIFAKTNGGGFLTDYFPDAYKVIWDFHGQRATSRHLPGVSFTGITHPGLFGTAPSAELLEKWNDRERALIATDPDRVPALALAPNPNEALAGALHQGSPEFDGVARDGARTIPPRENGGNHDIKNFTRGARVLYPVHVPGAKFSGGDLHFSQGDGEITFCGAIEMGGFIDFGVELIKGGMEKYGVTTDPIFMPGNVEPRYSEFISFCGVSVERAENHQEYLNATLAFRNACLNAIEYLKKFGYTGQQAYAIIGSAPIEGRVSAVVDIPNASCSLYIPTAIFDFDVRPNASGPRQEDRGQLAVSS
jgi:formamidase